MEPADVLAQVCQLVAKGESDSAATLVHEAYPFVPREAVERKYGAEQALRVFVRDGFIDRYSGKRLMFPGTLRLLSHLLPAVFPFHPNWKMSETHPSYWQLTPTVDHIRPVCLGGMDSEENWITTSMLRNSAKANWTLEELGWIVHPPGRIMDWDGQLAWFKQYIAANPATLKGLPALRVWSQAASRVAVS